MKKKAKKNDFKDLLEKYIDIKGLDIIVYLSNGNQIELNKSRKLVKNSIIVIDGNNKEIKIPLSTIRSVDLYAA
ncbi:MAG TPA: hypothetical protein VKQ10_08625 [Spirochaetota bacterium]|nr:hypothetical protein [Spirochaetota bacterium]